MASRISMAKPAQGRSIGGLSMDGVGILLAIVIGVIAGWIAEQVTGRRHGLITNLIVGLVGALIGWFLAEQVLNIDIEGFWDSLIASTIGAILLLFIFGLVRRR